MAKKADPDISRDQDTSEHVPAGLALEPEHEVAALTRTLVLGPYLTARAEKHGARQGDTQERLRQPQARIDEAVGLALAIDLTVVDGVIVPLSTLRPSTLLGKGKVEEIGERIKADEIRLVVIDAALSPAQQRNLEKAWGAKVIDRTGLILEIFGRRARTREGTLQVELAHLSYQKSRLVRSWTHLERQRGGFGFLGGPGETQIEADRRLIQERMTRLQRDLDSVVRTRSLHRQGRKRVPYPIIALVGYTNAGKSTLFNRLTRAEVLAQDMLFATLDPTARAIVLPHGAKAILSDTVGFISDLPTMLVAAFRATLEDVIEADVLLHVRDLSHPDTQAQAQDVEGILRDLGIETQQGGRLIEVWNKADLIDADERERLENLVALRPASERPILVSALTGEGIETLQKAIETRLSTGRAVFRVDIPAADGAALNWLYEEAEVMERRADADGNLTLAVRVAAEKEPRFINRFPRAKRIRTS
jgi:GTP-binding protein HflX